MPDASALISAVRASHERLTGLLEPLSEEQITGPSYDDDWTIAQVASHLGSQAEIFGLFLDSGLTGAATPEFPAFQEIWGRWDAAEPADQVRDSIRTNAELVTRLEATAADGKPFGLEMFGAERDLAGLATLRLSEHALHTWDVAVALDPDATLSPDAVELLVDQIGFTAERAGRVQAGADPVRITTQAPSRRFVLTLDPDVTVAADTADGDSDLTLPAEAFIRLVYGRLDPEHTPAGIVGTEHLETLRSAFPGV